MKNIASGIALLILAGMLSACGQKEESEQGTGAGQEGQSQQQESTPSQPAAPAGQ